MKGFFLLTLIAVTQICYSQDTDDSEFYVSENIKKGEATSVYPISLIKLIASPEQYHGKKVRMIGYINIEFEGNAIYLHKDDYEHHIFSNGIWLAVDENFINKIRKENLNKRYVFIEGTFNMNKRGHLGLWNGQLEEISRIFDSE